MRVFFRAVLHSNEAWHSIHFGVPSKMIALASTGAHNDVGAAKVPLQFRFKRCRQALFSFTMRLRGVKSRRTIAFPVIDLATIHAEGGKRFQMAAAMPPMMFCITPLKTPAAAASGILAKCKRASEAAKPPFCIPTSMLTVRAMDSG